MNAVTASTLHFASELRLTACSKDEKHLSYRANVLAASSKSVKRALSFSCKYIAKQRQARIRSSSENAPSAITATEDKEGQPETDAKIQSQLEKLATVFESLDESYLKKLPNDLQVQVRDAAFAVTSGSLQRTCGDVAADSLSELGRALEAMNAAACALCVRNVSEAALQLPPYSSYRLAVATRLRSAGRQLSAPGVSGGEELQRVSQAFLDAADVLGDGCTDKTDEPLPEGAKRSFKMIGQEVVLDTGRAYTGAIVSILFGVINWKLADNLRLWQQEDKFNNDNANMLAQSLRGFLITLTTASTGLSFIAAVGLVVLGLQLSSQAKSDKTS